MTTHRYTTPALLAAFLLVLAAGCGDEAGTDAGGTDAGGTDAGGTDAGDTDAGGDDAGSTDAGSTDAGGTDAGSTDAGDTDAGDTDAGGSDAGGSDGGTSVVVTMINTESAFGNCGLPTPPVGMQFVFVVVVDYDNSAGTGPANITVGPATVTLNDPGMTTTSMTFDVTTVPVATGGTALIRHTARGGSPVVPACSLCGTVTRARWQFDIMIDGVPRRLSGNTSFLCAV